MSLVSKLAFLLSVPLADYPKIRKLNLIRVVKPYTGLTYARLSKLYELSCQLEQDNVTGAFVECGVLNGGSAGVMAKVAEYKTRRHTWLFDSWEGMPEPLDIDVNIKGECGQKGADKGSLSKCRQLLLEKLQLEPSRVHLVKGWFQHTIPPNLDDIGDIALLHVDCDWYESVTFCLDQLYDDVTSGGYIVFDDYFHWEGCKKAVREFIDRRKLDIRLTKIDDDGVYFQKN